LVDGGRGTWGEGTDVDVVAVVEGEGALVVGGREGGDHARDGGGGKRARLRKEGRGVKRMREVTDVDAAAVVVEGEGVLVVVGREGGAGWVSSRGSGVQS
jgi:hypothetical protein